HVPEISIPVSLGVICAVLIVTTITSLRASKKPSTPLGAAPPDPRGGSAPCTSTGAVPPWHPTGAPPPDHPHRGSAP
ncbi:hypothetical protein ABZ251_32415, partial [Streptomyces chartreusis]